MLQVENEVFNSGISELVMLNLFVFSCGCVLKHVGRHCSAVIKPL